MHAREVLDALRLDAARYKHLGGWYKSEGFWIGATHRALRFAKTLRGPLRMPAVAACKAVNKVVWHTIYNVHISSDASIGPGLYLIHPRDIFIPAIQVGENFTVFHEVTIGSNGHPPKCPKIGNNVVIYVGARVLGGLEVGDGAKIGANCVVTRSVRPGSSVLPPPNRILPPTAAAAFGQKDFWGEDE